MFEDQSKDRPKFVCGACGEEGRPSHMFDGGGDIFSMLIPRARLDVCHPCMLETLAWAVTQAKEAGFIGSLRQEETAATCEDPPTP